MEGPAAHHLGRVLRAQPGQLYELSDGAKVYLGRIETVSRDRIDFALEEEIPSYQPAVEMSLLLSIVKFDAFEWALEKATELGVAAIMPVAAARSERALVAAAGKRAERWGKILAEAAQQSRRVRVPRLLEVTRPGQAFGGYPEARKIMLSERIGAPVYLSGMARGLLGAKHPLLYRHKRREALREADLVVLAGVPADFRLDQCMRRNQSIEIGNIDHLARRSRAQCGDRFRQRLLFAIPKADLGAGIKNALGHGKAQALCPSGDDGHLAIEVDLIHLFSPAPPGPFQGLPAGLLPAVLLGPYEGSGKGGRKARPNSAMRGRKTSRMASLAAKAALAIRRETLPRGNFYGRMEEIPSSIRIHDVQVGTSCIYFESFKQNAELIS